VIATELRRDAARRAADFCSRGSCEIVVQEIGELHSEFSHEAGGASRCFCWPWPLLIRRAARRLTACAADCSKGNCVIQLRLRDLQCFEISRVSATAGARHVGVHKSPDAENGVCISPHRTRHAQAGPGLRRRHRWLKNFKATAVDLIDTSSGLSVDAHHRYVVLEVWSEVEGTARFATRI